VRVALACSLVAAGSTFAHPLSPGLLQLEELGGGRYSVLWKLPATSFDAVRLVPDLPATCHDAAEPTTTDTGVAILTRWIVDCGDADLAGGTVRVVGLEQSSNDVLLSIVSSRGARLTAVLTASVPAYTVPSVPGLGRVLTDYGALGVRHILTGYDHVLFVIALTLLVGRLRDLAIAVTGFTLGHSLTLSLATLNLVQIAPAPVEALIAASIVVLAAEVAARGYRTTLVTRAPWLVTAIFGLFHGLGFAGALREIGLPYRQTVPALAAFNVGVELGQLGIVCVCLAIGALLRRVRAPQALRDARLAAYAIGVLAAFWTFERIVVAFGQT
jgi:hydrogenase/urease accessory protein HupE